jgi:transcriptional regulator with XRE-family HTH domain
MEELTLKQRLGQIIHNNRLSKKQSQKDLSTNLNYSQSMISRIEKGYDDLNLDLYLETLSKLGLFYDLSLEIEEQINTLIGEIYHHVLYLELEQLETGINSFNQFMPNCLYYYDFLAVELVELYFQGNDEECEIILKELIGNENLCHQLNQRLIKHIRLILESKNKKAVTWDPESIKREEMDELDHYAYGVIYYHHHQYSKSLMHLLYSIDQCDEKKNSNRMSHAEVIINKMLMKDHDYHNLKIRLQDLLNHHQIKYKSDANTLQFQLAYSRYYLKEYEQALVEFQALRNQTFEYDHLLDYMIFKCQQQLNQTIQVNDSLLLTLYHKFQNNEKDQTYYELIEHHILPELEFHLELKEYQLYTLDLMEHYFETKKYTKYKKLSELINRIYKVI